MALVEAYQVIAVIDGLDEIGSLLQTAGETERLRLWSHRGRHDRGGGQTGSRSRGQLMHRGPPRPRPSSLPRMVMTSMPCLRRWLLVVVLRS